MTKLRTKLRIGDKARVILPKDRHEGRNGIVTDILDIGIVVWFDDGDEQIYHKRGEVRRAKDKEVQD